MQAWRIRLPGAQPFGATSGIRVGCRDVANGPRARAGAPSRFALPAASAAFLSPRLPSTLAQIRHNARFRELWRGGWQLVAVSKCALGKSEARLPPALKGEAAGQKQMPGTLEKAAPAASVS